MSEREDERLALNEAMKAFWGLRPTAEALCFLEERLSRVVGWPVIAAHCFAGGVIVRVIEGSVIRRYALSKDEAP